MGVIHFLNVKEGDCTLIQHPTGNNTVIDVSNARTTEMESTSLEEDVNFSMDSVQGNFGQKNHPVNPIEYFNKLNITTIFRFILTHPDMDHMDGIKSLFDNFEVINFWDTNNNKEIDNFNNGKYQEEDWDFYQSIRNSSSNPKTLNNTAGTTAQFFNKDSEGNSGGDGLYILAPTPELVEDANNSKDYNDCSYVLLYRTGNSKKILFAGDSGEKTWDYILQNYKTDVSDIDILIAPHHGRKSGGNDKYLDTLKPKLTLFGNAKSQHLDYSSWNNRGLKKITNNQSDCIIIDTDGGNIKVYVTNEKFAKSVVPNSQYDSVHEAWHIDTI